MVDSLEAANYPIRDIAVVDRSDEVTEINTMLVGTSVEALRTRCGREQASDIKAYFARKPVIADE
jgi:hypothetical protein